MKNEINTDPIKVLVVDDDAAMRLMLKTVLPLHDEVEVVGLASSGEEAVELYKKLMPDVVLMDVEMPRVSGADATQKIVSLYPEARILAYTGHVDESYVSEMIIAGAVGYIVKGSDPSKVSDDIVKANQEFGLIDSKATPALYKSVVRLARKERARRQEVEQLNKDLQKAYVETSNALAIALRSRDVATHEHVDRVTKMSIMVAEQLGLQGSELKDVELGASFHDIGKIAVPDGILNGSESLSDDEWKIMKQHTIWGERIIEPLTFLGDVKRIVRNSHEKWDGSGYPDRLRREEIPLASRIIFCCDAFDALTSKRTYREPLSREEALEHLQELSGTHFDPKVVNAMTEALNDLPQAA